MYIISWASEIPCERATSAQRQPDVFYTSWTFGQRWLDVVQALRCVLLGTYLLVSGRFSVQFDRSLSC